MGHTDKAILRLLDRIVAQLLWREGDDRMNEEVLHSKGLKVLEKHNTCVPGLEALA